MTRHDKYIDAIERNRTAVLEKYHYRCQYVFPNGMHCSEPACECAHCIGQGEGHTRMAMKEWNQAYKENRNFNWIRNNVIHHILNQRASCNNKAHNSFHNIGNNPGKVRDKLQEIRENLIQSGVI